MREMLERLEEAKKMDREEAYRELKSGKPLSTGMLDALGISFEAFLKFAQMGDKKASEIIKKYLVQLEKKHGYK